MGNFNQKIYLCWQHVLFVLYGVHSPLTQLAGNSNVTHFFETKKTTSKEALLLNFPESGFWYSFSQGLAGYNAFIQSSNYIHSIKWKKIERNFVKLWMTKSADVCGACVHNARISNRSIFGFVNKINGAEVTYKEMKKFFHFEYKDTYSTNLVRLTHVCLIFL